MAKKYLITFFVLVAVCLALLFAVYFFRDSIAMLNPKGWVALKQRDLMIIATSLMLTVVVPVFILTAAIAWKYREGNQAEYSPNWDNSWLAETIWWGFPLAIILVLSIITWNSSYKLDPYKPIIREKKPLTIQVVALQWKWLFIYPEHNIASLNFFQFPKDTPLNFEITADAPMNSFWIPELGGQIYAMPGMKTKLHLIANEVGNFRGSSANLSGTGFSSMTFNARSSNENDFDEWVQKVKNSSNSLGLDEYQNLAKPSSYVSQAFYSLKKENLFDWIVMKPMMPKEI